jgi:CubicO group peptidase (beta-lactamase class C family)
MLLLLGVFACGMAHAVDKDAEIHHMMEAAGIPGLQTVVVKDGRVVWAKSYGYGVLDHPGPRAAMRNDSIVLSASVAKILVTVAVLQQVEKGTLALDEDINRSLPFAVRNPAWPDVPITWRMLLTHTSSMNTEDDARASATAEFGHDSARTLDDYVRNAFVPGGAFYWAERFRSAKPGSERIYSNDAFDLAASALQRVTGEEFVRYLGREVLTPLGMRDTSYWLAGRPIARYAVGYATIRQKGGAYTYIPAREYWAHLPARSNVLDYQFTCPNYAEGCAHTTALDFARVMLMLMNGGVIDGKQVLKPSSVAAMVTPTGLRTLDGWAQALGLAGPEDLRGRQVWGHAGDDRGAANAFYFNRETGVGAIAFANAMDPDWTLTYSVVDIDLHLMSWFEGD